MASANKLPLVARADVAALYTAEIHERVLAAHTHTVGSDSTLGGIERRSSQGGDNRQCEWIETNLVGRNGGGLRDTRVTR